MSEDDEPDDAAAAFQAEKDKRGGVKRSQNGMKACNWWVGDADQGHYCDQAAGYSADKTTGLFRCIHHGGNAQKIKAGTQGSGRGGCQWTGGCDKSQQSGHHPGYVFCTAHYKLLKPKVEAAHGEDFKPPKGFDFSPFYPPPPPTSAAGV